MKTSIETLAPSGLRLTTLSGATMGTRYSARFFAALELDVDAVGAAVFAAVDAVDRQMSTWNPASDLMRLNAAPLDEWQSVPPNLIEVLAAAIHIGTKTGGAFDIGVGDDVDAWGFGAGRRAPDVARAAALALEARHPTAQSLDIDAVGFRVRKTAILTLDLSGIAKGFGVDELARCLDRQGVGSYLVGIDGEMRARGRKPGAAPWLVAVERPDHALRSAHGVIALDGEAVATSGDYRHAMLVDGERLSHTIDPKSRRPLRNRVASVTVIAQTTMEADALATALMVMGAEDGAVFAKDQGIDALFMLREGDRIREIGCGRFADAPAPTTEAKIVGKRADPDTGSGPWLVSA